MADIFASKEVRALLKDKKVVLIGDSNTRATYKDLICLYQKNSLISAKVLKTKMEQSVFNDKLEDHGRLYKGRGYVEHRKFSSDHCNISFYFITRVYSDYMEKVIEVFEEKGSPDVIILNSSLWDICRWGPRGVEGFRENLKTLMKRFNEVLSEKCIVLWVTTPPVSQEMKGGFLIDQLEFLAYSLRFHILEANSYARRIVVRHGYDVVDVHYHLQMQLTKRADDGIHWVPLAVRHVTNLILSHISLAWGVPLPHRIETVEQYKISASEADESDHPSLEQNALPGNNNVQALKEIENRQGSSYAKRKKKKRVQAHNNSFDETYHGFRTRRRVEQAHRKIHQWRNDDFQPQPFLSPIASAHHSRTMPDHALLPTPYYSPHHQPMQQYHFEPNYQCYAENSPAPYAFSNPEFMQPNFNWTDMRQIQFGKYNELAE